VIVLAMETSTARSSVAVLADGEVVASEHHEDARGHGAFLAPAIRRCLEPVGGAGAVDAVAVGTGPGLYTGLRVGMATAAALAWARSLPVVGVGGLDVLARMTVEQGASAAASPGSTVVTTLDARRGQVFWAVHEHEQAGASEEAGVRCIDGPRVGPREELDEAVVALAQRGDVLVVGEVGGDRVVRPDAATLGQVAGGLVTEVASDQRLAAFPPSALVAVYLRDADVRIGWNERGGVRVGGPA